MATVTLPLSPKIVTEGNNRDRKSESEAADSPCMRYMEIIDEISREHFLERPVKTRDDLTMECCINHPDSLNGAVWCQLKKAVLFGKIDNNSLIEKGMTPLIEDAYLTSLSVTGHEFGHAFVQSHSPKGRGLNAFKQAGALSESIGDVFGIMAKHFHISKTTGRSVLAHELQDDDWKIGEGIYLNSPNSAIRSMIKPGTASAWDIQKVEGKCVDRATLYKDDFTKENEAIYRHAGIPNRAFALAAQNIKCSTWGIVGQIWVGAIKRVKPTETFAQFAAKTVEEAGKFGVAKLVSDAWEEVEIIPGKETIGQKSKHPVVVTEYGINVRTPTV